LNFYKFNIGNKINFINKSLKETKLPHIFNRKPHKIEEVSKWKSSEIKIFLFYESIPIFFSILPSCYFYKYCAYVIAIRIYYEPIISNQDLLLAKTLIDYYLNTLEETFSINACTYTAHAHKHLYSQVLEHGSLHANSMFIFEVMFQYLN